MQKKNSCHASRYAVTKNVDGKVFDGENFKIFTIRSLNLELLWRARCTGIKISI